MHSWLSAVHQVTIAISIYVIMARGPTIYYE